MTSGPEVCEGTLQQADEIPEMGVPGAAPLPLGGTIDPGTYLLTEITKYRVTPPPSIETGAKAKKTLLVVGNAMRTIGVGGALALFVDATHREIYMKQR